MKQFTVALVFVVIWLILCVKEFECGCRCEDFTDFVQVGEKTCFRPIVDTLLPTRSTSFFPDQTGEELSVLNQINGDPWVYYNATEDDWFFSVGWGYSGVLIISDGKQILVDTGLGETTTRWPQYEKQLYPTVTELGCGDGELDYVVTTHLHGDHTGWNVKYDDDDSNDGSSSSSSSSSSGSSGNGRSKSKSSGSSGHSSRSSSGHGGSSSNSRSSSSSGSSGSSGSSTTNENPTTTGLDEVSIVVSFSPPTEYILQYDEYRYWSNESLRANVLWEERVETLQDNGQLVLRFDYYWLTSKVQVQKCAGHTPGHQCVFIYDDDDIPFGVVTGDLIHHPIQIQMPTYQRPTEYDLDEAISNREMLIDEIASNDLLIMAAHFNYPNIGVIEECDDCGGESGYAYRQLSTSELEQLYSL